MIIDILFTISQKIPEGHFKEALKTVFNYCVYRFSFQTEEVVIRGVKILCYKDYLTSNRLLVTEETGYNQYYTFKKGDTVIDCGPYTGLFTIYAAKRVGEKGKVIAFELDPYNCIILKKNLKLNKIKNVLVINRGIYKKDAIMPMTIHGVGSAIKEEGDTNTFNTIEVVSLDNELKRLGIKRVDFIKMDIEGAENEAMKGLKKTLKANKDINLAIASYHIVDGKQTRLTLEPFFKSLGMSVITGYDKHLTTYVRKRSFTK